MKKMIKLSVALAVLASLAPSATANTITLGDVSAGLGGGPYTYTYSYEFANSLLMPGDFFTINDFGPAVVVAAPVFPAAWGFSQLPLGPNSLLVGPADDGAILNATFTWGGPATVVGTASLFFFTLSSPYLPAGLDIYTSRDHVASSPGSISVVGGSVTVPAAPAVPDGGLTLALLGFALVGVESLRRKLLA